MNRMSRDELVAYYKQMADEAQTFAENLALTREQFLRLARAGCRLPNAKSIDVPH